MARDMENLLLPFIKQKKAHQAVVNSPGISGPGPGAEKFQPGGFSFCLINGKNFKNFRETISKISKISKISA